MEVMENWAGAVTIISFICVAFNYIVIKPLQLSIIGLQKSIDKLTSYTDSIKSKQHEIEITINDLINREKSNAHRLDRVEDWIKEHNKKSVGGDVYVKA